LGRSLLMARDRRSFAPALVVSVVVHVGVIALALLYLPKETKKAPFGSVVPVTIVSNAPMTSVAPAIEAPMETDALTDEPLPDLPPTVEAPPAPEPIPAPQPTPPPKPTPKPAEKPKPTPASKPVKQAELNFDDLEKRLRKAGGGQTAPSGGRQGPPKPATSPTPRPDGKGKGINASSIAGLVDELQRRWNPNCEVEGGSRVKLTVQIRVAPSGQLLEPPKIVRGLSDDAMVQAAATRARLAVSSSVPFRNLPEEYYGEALNLNFDAQKACSL
jgi:protein TonB